jgi:hypothetical protein
VKITTLDMEIALANHFDYRQNLIVPNISSGMHIHECDLFIVTKKNYCYEVEIKISKADLKKDSEKKHNHKSGKIKRLYFAIPDHLQDCIEYIPERAGIIIVRKNKPSEYYYQQTYDVREIREPVENNNSTPLTDKERYNVARLGTMRIWGLKRKLCKQTKSLI